MRRPFLLTPLREGRHGIDLTHDAVRKDFYSRPCGRGDIVHIEQIAGCFISTHAPAGGATKARVLQCLREVNFYSRPCGRGDILHC